MTVYNLRQKILIISILVLDERHHGTQEFWPRAFVRSVSEVILSVIYLRIRTDLVHCLWKIEHNTAKFLKIRIFSGIKLRCWVLSEDSKVRNAFVLIVRQSNALRSVET